MPGRKFVRNLGFSENSNFIRGSTKAAAGRSCGINARTILVPESYYSKVTGFKPVTLLK